MSTSGALLIGEDWISEHYFTTDAKSQSFLAKTLEQRKQWDDADVATVRTRFTAARSGLEKQLAAVTLEQDDENLAGLYEQLRQILGYGEGLTLHRTGPVLLVATPGITGAPLAIIEAKAVSDVADLLDKEAKSLLTSYDVDDKEQIHSVARLLSALFNSTDAPTFALVMAGPWLMITDAERWPEGRYLAVNLQLVCERNHDRRGGEIDRALACLSADSLAPDADGEIWWTGVLADSVKHTVGVSQDLREGVRLSIEIIANEVVRRRAAQGLEPLPKDQAQVLAVQSLRFLYRILFLLWAEASPELGVLPVGAAEYEQGYGVDRLRELVLVDLATPHAQQGTHLYSSLGVLFRLVDQGSASRTQPMDDEPGSSDGLTFRSLRADLFSPKATAHIDQVGLGNNAVQDVLRHLLLSKETRGRDRGFISYAQLGINQLGAVYEGLMSYTGFFAEEDLFEVAKNGDAGKGSWVVPVARADGISQNDFVRMTDPVTGESTPVRHNRGTFVYRLAGRDRQQSASYYTPEVLTRFTVGQALAELLDQNGETTPACDILNLTVCEPALGSGAFAIEAVSQLADEYLKRRQNELGTRIDPDEYPRRLQEVKAYLALHQVYGVDLNATAVELAEISLWLGTMTPALDAPWFGLHLRRGNSLIGVRRAVFHRSQITDKSCLKDVPGDVPLADLDAGINGRVHHFLLPAEGWGAAIDAKEAKPLAPEALQRLREWRRSILSKPTKVQTNALIDLAERVESLWGITLSRLQIAEAEIRRSIPVWGADNLAVGGHIQREEIERTLAEPKGAYQRLRRIMDAWCALWFWPLTDTLTTAEDGTRIHPPTLAEWIEAGQMLLGRHAGKKKTATGQDRLDTGNTWAELGTTEDLDLGLASAATIEATLAKHSWLKVCEQIASQQGFFHWELDFAPVFARGGFDLQLGNPPWVRPRSDVDALLAEGDPWWQLENKPSEEARKERRPGTLALNGIQNLVIDGTADVAATAAFVGSVQHFPHLAGLQPDLYRCFMEQTWRHVSARGAIVLISLESHFTDEKAGGLRAATYERLRRHWHFVNELRLFDIEDHKHYGIAVYGPPSEVRFTQASWLYHPDTAVRSFAHDGSGPEPGLKDPDGNWDLRPHRNRLVIVTPEVLKTWHEVLEVPEVPVLRSRMVYAVNRATSDVLGKLSEAERVGALGLQFSSGWHEKNDRTKGYFVSEWGRPLSWDDVILQGPHLFVSTPMYKSPNETMLHNQDWSATDFEALASDAIPVTSYKPAGDRAAYDARYTHWTLPDGDTTPARDHYRVAWRYMAPNTGERTLAPCLLPPGPAHIHGVATAGNGSIELATLATTQGVLSSLLADFSIRTAPKATISAPSINRLSLPADIPPNLADWITHRSLRLNCVTEAFGEMWEASANSTFSADAWTAPASYGLTADLADVPTTWTPNVPLRIAADRRQAQLEIDALVALMLGVTADELCTIYRTQFPVLYGYDRNRDHYDANGRLVPNSVLALWRKKGDAISLDGCTATNQAGNTYVYELPFVTLDREHDMRVAYVEFERRLAEPGAGAGA